MGLASTLFAAALGVGACQSAVFSCLDDSDCTNGNRTGTCQPSAYCSVEDDTCPSGQRYLELAPSNLAGQCVPVGDGAETDDATASTTAPTTSDTTSTTTIAATTTGPSTDPAATDPLTTGVSTGSTTATTQTSSSDADDGSSSTATPLDQDLVLWLAFDGEPTQDSGPLGLTVTCAATCPTATAGVNGGAAAFDDSPLFVEGLSNISFPGLSVTYWVRGFGESTGFQAIVTWPLGNAIANAFESYYVVAENIVVFSLEGVAFRATTADATQGVWTHYAATWDGAMIRLYASGILVDTAPAEEMPFDENPVVVGGDIDNSMLNNELLGALDEVMMWRRPLSDAEVLTLATR